MPHVEPHRRLAGPLQLRLDGERHLVARRQLVHEALAIGVQERRALPAHRLRDQEAVARAVEPQRGWVELHELEIGEPRPGVAREAEARPNRATRVGGAGPERGGAAGGEDHGTRRERHRLPLTRP